MLAGRAGYARHHFLRLFKEITGVTPHSYAASVRARRLQASLAAGDRVAEAVAGAGYGSESRVYRGARPGAWHDPRHRPARWRGRDHPHRHGDERDRPADGRRHRKRRLFHWLRRGFLTALEGDLRQRFPRARVEPAPEALAATVRQVVTFLEEPKAALALPLDLRGTAFQRRVWEALQAIPFGETRTYGQMAEAIGAPRRCGRWRGPARRTMSRWRSPATGWWARMAT